MTIATASARSTAPASAFFARWADMETWPEWNTDTAWVRLDGPFEQGATGTLKPKGGPKVPFTVTRLSDHEFVDVSRMPGGRITFAHTIEEDADGTRLDVSVDITGPLGALWRLVLARDFAKTLQPDLDRLVATAEADVSRVAWSRALDSAYDESSRSPGLLLWQVTNRWQAAIRATLAPYGLTHVQFVLLASLTWLDGDGPVTQRRLADHAATDPMMTSQVLRTLETRGLVVRRPHPDDGRAKSLAPTPEGIDLARASNGAVERCDRDFFAALGTGHDDFVAGLGRLAATSPRRPA